MDRYDLGQTNIFYDETHPLLSSFVLPTHVEVVNGCFTDFSCLVNEKNDSVSITSRDMAKDLEQGLNPDPTYKAAEMIKREVLSKVRCYDENVYRGIFEKRFFDQLTDSLSTNMEDSRRQVTELPTVTRNEYYYDQVIRYAQHQALSTCIFTQNKQEQ
ncbi:hypothetical protein LB506_005172 [Fusarium annulatum]|nr:hypothetical protein LB506_005172 [Fusarium annulatum]